MSQYLGLTTDGLLFSGKNEEKFINAYKQKWAETMSNTYFQSETIDVGHKLRPRLVFWGYSANSVLFKDDNIENVAQIAVCIELIHKASLMKTVECSSMSEFYEKAVQFYVLHLHLKHNESYFGEILSRTLEGMINRLGDRIAKMQFKDIVSGTQLFMLLANEYEWSQEYIDGMYGHAVEEAKKIPSVKLWNEERRYD